MGESKKSGSFSARGKWFLPAGLVLLAVMLSGAAAFFPFFPGDVAVARFIQSLAPQKQGWAVWLTSTARAPQSYVLLGIVFVLAWVISGWRAACLAVASFVAMSFLGQWINPLIARPRPSPRLIHVAGSLSGYSFPSTFALVYASTVGFLAAVAAFRSKQRQAVRLILFLCCVVLLIAGGVARITLGAHWPSDILLSYFIVFVWIVLVLRFA
jgi:membrane-associated phospholipid phosphatase